MKYALISIVVLLTSAIVLFSCVSQLEFNELQETVAQLNNYLQFEVHPLLYPNVNEIAELSLFPTVQILDVGRRSSGTGVIIGNMRVNEKTIRNFVLTAKHVVENHQKLNIILYDYYGGMSKVPHVKILSMAQDIDAAILYFDSAIFLYTALVTEDEVELFTSVYSVASHIGCYPFLVPGIISLNFTETNDGIDKNYYIFIGESMFGNSGGPIFNLKTKEVEGIIIELISARVATSSPMISVCVPLNYMCHVLKWTSIRDWLDGQDLSYVYDTEIGR